MIASGDTYECTLASEVEGDATTVLLTGGVGRLGIGADETERGGSASRSISISSTSSSTSSSYPGEPTLEMSE